MDMFFERPLFQKYMFSMSKVKSRIPSQSLPTDADNMSPTFQLDLLHASPFLCSQWKDLLTIFGYSGRISFRRHQLREKLLGVWNVNGDRIMGTRIEHKHLFPRLFGHLRDIPAKLPGYPTQSLFASVSRDIPNFLASTPSRGRPHPKGWYPDQKGLSLCSFSWPQELRLAWLWCLNVGEQSPCRPKFLGSIFLYIWASGRLTGLCKTATQNSMDCRQQQDNLMPMKSWN